MNSVWLNLTLSTGVFPVLGVSVFLSFAGAAVVRRSAPGTAWTMALGWGWIIGSGLASFSALGVAGAGLPLQTAIIPPVLALFFYRKGLRFKHLRPEGRLLFSRILLGVVLCCMLAAVVTTTFPGWDGLAIWGERARRILSEGRLPLESMRDPLGIFAHPEYPLHVPLRAALVASITGGWSETIMPALSLFDILASFLLLLGVLESVGSQGLSRNLLFSAIVLIPFSYSQLCLGYADLTLAASVLGILLAVRHWFFEENAGAFLIISVLCAAVAAWCKQEGLVLSLLVYLAAIILAFSRNRKRAPLFLAASGVLVSALPWILIRHFAGFPLDRFRIHSLSQFQRFPIILKAMVQEFLDLEKWSLLWVFVILYLMYRFSKLIFSREIPREQDLGGLFLILALSGIFLIYLATPRPLEWHLSTSLARLLLQLEPAAALVFLGTCLPDRVSADDFRSPLSA